MENNKTELTSPLMAAVEVTTQDIVSEISPETGYVEVTDPAQLADLMAVWLKDKVDLLNHLSTIPDGVSMKVISDDGQATEDYVMEGDLKKGFQFGLAIAITEIGKLPFSTGFEPSKFPEELPVTVEAEDVKSVSNDPA